MSAVIQNEYTGNNSTTTYSFTFPYLKTSDIKASLDGVETTAFTLPNATTLQFNTAPPQDAKIKIFRETSVDNLTATFYAGSAIKSEDLNDNFTQNLYKTQEIGGRFISNLGGTMTGDLNMGEDTVIKFEGATDDAHETTLTVADPTADRTITLPNVTGTVVTTGDTGTVATGMIANDAINGTKIADDTINSEHYAANSIDTEHIDNLQITTAKIANDAIVNGKIADNAIDSEHYTDGSIDTEHLADSLITTAKIANDAVTADKLANTSVSAGSYTTADITVDAQGRITSASSGVISTSEISDDAITTAKLAADSVTNAKIADDSIDSEHYVDGSIDTAHLGNLQVTTAKIAADAINGDKIADDAINSEHYANLSINAAHLNNSSVTTAKIEDSAVTSAKIANGTIATADIADGAITSVKIANGTVGEDDLAAGGVVTVKIADNAVTTAKIANSNVTTAKIADSNITTAKIADDAVTNAKIADGTLDGRYYTETELDAGQLDNRYYTETEADARFYNLSSGEEIQSGETWSAADNKIATTAAIDARIIDLVDDVGGFVPIANETSFPNANPDVNNGAGTIVSIGSLSSNLTSNGSGVITISNGTVGNSTVTITGAENSTTYNAGYGLLVETTTTLNTYTFHRLSSKATEVTTVAGSISSVNTVAGAISNVNSVASNASNINTVASNNTNVTNVGGNISNVNAVANNASNINAVAADATDIGAVAGKATEIGRLGTADAVADLAILGTTDVVSDMNTLATTAIVSDMDTLADIASNITTVANNNSNVTTVAGNNSNITTVAGANSNISTVAGSISNVNTTASNIGNVNNFANTYQIASSNPSTDGGGNSLAAGDLYFNTSSNELRVYNGSAWQGGVTATGNLAGLSSNTFTGNQSHGDNVKNIFGGSNDLQIYHDGSASYIDNTHSGGLYVRGGSSTGYVVALQAKNSENSVKCIGDGAVELYHDANKKFETVSGGVSVTGNITVSGTVDGVDVAGLNTTVSNITSNATHTGEVTGSGALTITDGAVVTARLANNAVTANKIANGAIQTTKLDTGAVTESKIGDNAISQHKIINGNVTTAKIAADAVTNAKIADDSIDSEHYVDGSIDTAHIADDAVTMAKIANDAVGSNQLANTSVTAASYGSSSAIPVITIDAQGRITAASTAATSSDLVADTTPQLGGDLDTNGNNINFAANDGAVFASDLTISHTGDHGNIVNTDGNLNIKSQGRISLFPSTNNDGIVIINGGAVELYHNNNKKFETTSSGVSVTGTVAATSYTGDGSSLTGVASAVADGCIYENSQTISNNYTISTNKNALSAGPITIANGVTLTIPTGSVYTIV